MPESDVKKELRQLMSEIYDEGLAAVLTLGIERMSEEDAEKILGDLQEYEKRMPEILAQTDELIRSITENKTP